MSHLPTGTLTFLYTDIESSTVRWEQYPGAMKAAVERHDAILQAAVEVAGGVVFRRMGDAFCACFALAPQAVDATLAAQRALQREAWDPRIAPIKVRMALHTGAGEVRDGDYVGPHLNRIARLLSVAYGGQVLLTGATHALICDSLPDGTSLADLGEHKLKDLQRSGHIFQLISQDLPSEFSPIKTLDSRPNNLPAQPTEFVGREDEIERAQDLLGRPQVRLVTFSGPGGTGKTRMALQVGVKMLARFQDGVFFVPLTSLSDSTLVPGAISEVLGIIETGGRSALESLKDKLGEKEMLLILDNFEQVMGASRLVGELLPAAPGLKVLVTSREVLHIYGEKEFPVPPLQLPDPRHLPSLEVLARYESIHLFVARARDVKPDFSLASDNAAAIAEICVRLDGLPLPIELAAARIKVLPPQAILARLQSSLKLLTGGGRDLPARQQTLRGAIEWSYDLLDEGEQQLFRRLSVFVGGHTLEAIEAICNAHGDLAADVLDGVQSLVDKSLLRQAEGVGGEPRFIMLGTIREYAWEKLQESGEGEELSNQHAEYFLNIAEEAEAQLKVSDERQWSEKVAKELDNYRAALTWLLRRAKETGGFNASGAFDGTGIAAEEALRLSAALIDYWFGRNWEEGKRWVEEALANVPTPEAAGVTPNAHIPQISARARAKALRALALVAWAQGDAEQGRRLAEEWLAIEKDLGDKYEVSRALNTLGSAHQRLGDLEGALAYRHESLALSRELGDKVGISRAVNNLGEVARLRGEYDKAIAHYEESLRINRELGDTRGVGINLNNLGLALYCRGEYARVQAVHGEALRLWRELSAPQGVAYPLMGFAGLAQAGGRPVRAARLLAAAGAMLELSGAVLGTSDRPDYERILGATRAQLDDDAWQQAWEEGRAMSMEQAVEYALEQGPEREVPMCTEIEPPSARVELLEES